MTSRGFAACLVAWAALAIGLAPPAGAQPGPPDTTPPAINDRIPAASAVDVPRTSTVRFCAYDLDSGVDVPTLSATLTDGLGSQLYSATATPANVVVETNSAACTSSQNAGLNGVRVTITPLSYFEYNDTVTVAPAFRDNYGNNYVGGSYQFFTEPNLPPPPDTTAPTLADRNPTAGAGNVPVNSTIAFCAYDAGRGVSLASVQVAVNDGTLRTYSAALTPASFSAVTNSASCQSGQDGDNYPFGVRVTVTPITSLSAGVTVTVQPSFSDEQGNGYAGGSYQFNTTAAPDATPPYCGSEDPASGAVAVDVSADVAFCAYDDESPIALGSIAVTLSWSGGTPTTYSEALTASQFEATVDVIGCPSGGNGVRVVINPASAFPYNKLVTVAPAFTDVASNAYAGGNYSFTTATSLPDPPDTTPPTVSDRVPAAGGTGVLVTTTIAFCAYDVGAGINLTTLQLTVDDGTVRIYSEGATPASFDAVVDSPSCTAGQDGNNYGRGVRVTVTPIANLAAGTVVSVTPAFADEAANGYSGGAYTFTTEAAPDTVRPTRGNENPANGAVAVDVNSDVGFCTYDDASGINLASVAVTLSWSGGTPTTYSEALTAAEFNAAPDAVACPSGTNGVLVGVNPGSAFPYTKQITVSPAFSDNAANAYNGGTYSFTTSASLPDPPDTTAPTVSGRSPAAGAGNVPVTTSIAFCAYDVGAGINLATLQVTVNDGTARVYSESGTPASFDAAFDSALCTAGQDGNNYARGVRVTVTPSPNLANGTLVSVTPAFADEAGNAYAGGAYTFTTEAAADVTRPTRGTENPAPGAVAVDVYADVAFCAYDENSGVNVGSIEVTLSWSGGTPTTYSSILTPSEFSAAANGALCPSGGSGTLVTVNPGGALPYNKTVTVAPVFADNAANAYNGGSYGFTTADSPPPPPDSTPPTIADESPARSATNVAVNTLIELCAYDQGWGVDVSTIEVTINDGTATTYSELLTPSNFTAVVNDPACTSGADGDNYVNGVRVTVLPLTDLSDSTNVIVTPAFYDEYSTPNAYSGGSYQFQTIDVAPPYRGNENPAPASIGADVGSNVVFCAYDDATGVNLSSLQVTLTVNAVPTTYSAVLTPSEFAAVPSAPACPSGGGGVLVTVNPSAAFPVQTVVTVAPAFTDNNNVAYVGGSYAFTTASGIPPPPDGTAPYLGNRVPAPGQIDVPSNAAITLCVYDDGAGVALGSISITVDDTSVVRTYSSTQNSTAFSTIVNDASCAAGTDAGLAGVRVTVTPISPYPVAVTVSVLPAFQDRAIPANSYAGGAYAFDTVTVDPVVMVPTPAEGAVVGGLTLVRVQAFDPTGLATAPDVPVKVSWQTTPDFGNTSHYIALATENENFDVGLVDPSYGVFDLFWNTANGVIAADGITTIGVVGANVDTEVTLHILVANAAGGAAEVTRVLRVRNVGGQAAGSGKLLRRELGGALCESCHEVETHSAKALGNEYGNWGFDCLTCHSPHGTRNLMLVREQIPLPASAGGGFASIDLRNLSEGGPSDFGLFEADGGANGNSGRGICEVCHTQTSYYRRTGGGAGGSHATSGCPGCHTHRSGFNGQGNCSGCHYAPPPTAAVGDVHLIHTGPSATTAYGGTSGNVSAAEYGFGCGKCHPLSTAWHQNDTAHDGSSPGMAKVVEIVFDSSAAPANPSAVWTAGTSNAEQGQDGRYFKYSAGTCAGAYCHGSFAGGTAANVATFKTAAPNGGQCGDCHGASAATPPVAGSHAKHAGAGAGGNLGLPCATCHEGVVDSVPTIANRMLHANGGANWDLQRTDGRMGLTAVYGPSGGRSEAGVKAPPSAVYGQCDNVYCHSNGSPVDGRQGAAPYAVAQQPTWGGSLAGGCIGCHGTSGVTTSATLIGGASNTTSYGSVLHSTHLDTSTYGFKCDDCHDDTVQDRTSNTTLAAGQTTHVNTTKDVKLTSWPAAQTSGSWNATNHECSNLYCHSQGKVTTGAYTGGADAPLVTPDWDGPTAGCATCHDFASPVSSSLSGAHFKHTETDGIALPCDRCHGQTAAGGAIADYTRHVNGNKDLYLKNAPNQAEGTGALGTTCGGLYCHSAGNDFAAPFVDARTPSWSGSGTCYLCHGTVGSAGAPSYAGGSPKANSHSKHSNHACNTCHSSVVNGTPAIIAPALHVNGVYDLAASSGQFTVGTLGTDTTPTSCNSITCHGGNNGQWGGVIRCADCHLGAGDVNNWDIADSTTSRLDSTEWTSVGHGQASTPPGVPFEEFGSATDRCVYCHDDQNVSATHNQSANPFRLRGAADATGATAAYSTVTELDTVAACLSCHDESASVAFGVDPDGAGGQPKVGPATTRVNATHHGSKHGAGNDGGQRCWDCHDPHGDSANIKMIGLDVLADGSDVHGLGGTRATATVSFTVSGIGGFTDTVGPPYNGVCQVCHTSTIYWHADGTLTHNSGQDCAGCHTHQQPPSSAFLGAGACSGCHLEPTAAGNQDVDNYVYNNGTKAMIDGDDWATYGHGATVAFAQSGNAAPGFPVTPTAEGCYYCHAPDAAIAGGNGDTSSHGDAADPFRLTNTGGSDGKNGVCLACHKAASSGFDPDGAGTDFTSAKSAVKKVGATHYGADHTATGDGGMFCWDCHDPHGDYSYTVGSRAIAYMIQEQPVRDHAGASGWGVPTTLATAVDFNKAAGLDAANFDGRDYVDANATSGYNGVCQVCHASTAHWLSNGTLTHENGAARCVSCHAHEQPASDAFKPATSCNVCHPNPPGGGRHVAHLSASPSSTYGDTTVLSTPTEYDFGCGKCHGATASNHMNDEGGTASDAYRADMSFDLGGTYPALVAPVGTETGSTTPALYFGWQSGTCADAYCHDPLGAGYAGNSVSWNTTASLVCTSCHDDAYNQATTVLPGAHDKHSTTASTSYNYGCERCHDDTVLDSATLRTTAGQGKVKHVNGSKNDVKFNTSPLDQAAGTFSGGTTGTCSNTYCHSNGVDRTAPFTSGPSITWDATRTCGSCHSAGSAMATRSHALHVNNATYLTTSFGCITCHDTVADDSTIAAGKYGQHVNAAVETTGTSYSDGSADGVANGSCAANACHSDGTETPGYKSVTWGGTDNADNCKECHGSDGAPDFTSAYGEPNYVNNTGAYDTRNSHKAHVSTVLATAKTQCVNCHAATVDAAGALLASSAHVSGAANISGAKISSYTDATETCNTVTCHGGASPQWGGSALFCADCHGGASDVNNWNVADDTISKIATGAEWTTYGHGSATVNLAQGKTGIDICRYCHDWNVGHATGTNPFRLLGVTGANGAITAGNFDAAANNGDGVCWNCHGTGQNGVDPDGSGATAYLLKTGTKKIDSYHFGGDHTTFGTNGGSRCWDCHDPHGDATNLAMVGSDTLRQSSDAYGLTGTRSTTNAILTTQGAGGYAKATTPFTGVCQVCHTNTSYYKADGTSQTHNTGADCTAACHQHDQTTVPDAFKGKGGGPDCWNCHSGGQGGTRALSGDFTKQSHHVRGTMSSTMPSSAGTGNNADCVVCHAEGQIITAYSADCTTGALPMTCTNPTYHANGKIDLRDVDTAAPARDGAGASFLYDKDKVAAAAATLADWGSKTQLWREWTSGVNETGNDGTEGVLPSTAGLDRFCLTCHDSGGAAQVSTFRVSTETSRTALDPFWDGTTNITNSYDGLSRGQVVDIKSKVSGAPPTQGSFARHALRGQSASKYTQYTTAAAWPSNPNGYSTIYSAGRFTSMGTDENGDPNWNDKSVMGCADCHTVDGANTTTGNAHGSTSEYLLKDASGGAAEGTYAAGTAICLRCHTGYSAAHTGGSESNDFEDTVTTTAPNRLLDAKGKSLSASVFGFACMNCHGGAQGNGAGAGDTNPFGWIHGTSQVFKTGASGGTGTRNAYRFMNGSSLRYYMPGGVNWDTGAGSCFTLSSADSWGSCTQHSGSAQNPSTLKRSLTY
ncbi:MAG: CxxxxCH/CxxCH domain-containing protein [Deltaproteobacteria bacterium]|nr:CxxxxCH/CxxCH domain-containing protein [Deltaproteobacteria bacterium]